MPIDQMQISSQNHKQGDRLMTRCRDRFEYLKRSLFIAYIMASGDTCPQGTFTTTVVASLRRHYPERFCAGAWE